MVGVGGCRDGTPVPSAARVAINITLGQGGRHGSAVPTCGGHCRDTPVPSLRVLGVETIVLPICYIVLYICCNLSLLFPVTNNSVMISLLPCKFQFSGLMECPSDRNLTNQYKSNKSVEPNVPATWYAYRF